VAWAEVFRLAVCLFALPALKSSLVEAPVRALLRRFAPPGGSGKLEAHCFDETPGVFSLRAGVVPSTLRARLATEVPGAHFACITLK
jgi:hypothetical protein